MELADEVLTGLASLKDTKRVSDEVLQELVDITFDIAAKVKTEDDLRGSKVSSALKPTAVKQLYAALISLVFECAKKNTHPIGMKDFLTQQQLPPERAEIISKKYAEVLPKLRAILGTTGFNFPHIVDVDWRLDYLVRSDAVDKVNRPLYFIRFKTRDKPDSVPQTVEFTCTVEQLQDFVNKLQDAVHSINRLDLT